MLRFEPNSIKWDYFKKSIYVKIGVKIGVKLGGGVIINNKTIISLNYFGLGKHKIKSTTDSPVGSDEVDWKSKVNYLTLTVGFEL